MMSIERKKVRFKKFAAVVPVAVLALGLAACGGSGSASDSGGGGTIEVYTHNDPDETSELVEDAEAETGLQIDVLKLSANEGWSRVQREAPNFGADMQWGQLESMALRGVEEGYLEPYDSPTWEDVPDEFKDPEGRWYGWSYWFNLITVNEEAIEEKGLDTPESWADLIDPQYEGEIALPNPGTSGTGYLFVSTILQIMGEEEGWEYLEALDENVGQYTKSGPAPAQLVGQGEYAVGITWDRAVFDHIDEGYPMEAILPEEGVGYSLDVIWMFKGTDNRDEVETLIDYIGSEKGMEAAAQVRSMVTRPDIEGEAPIENLEDHLIDYDAVWADENEEEIMQEWRETFGSN